MEYRSKQSYRTHYYNSLFIGSTCIYPTAPIQPLPVLYLQIPYPYFFSFFLNTLKNSVNEKSESSIIGIESRICLLFPTNNKGGILYGKIFLTSGIHIFFFYLIYLQSVVQNLLRSGLITKDIKTNEPLYNHNTWFLIW